jgi:ferredoxin
MSLNNIRISKICDENGELVVGLFEKEIAKGRETKVLVALENIDTNQVIIQGVKENIVDFVKGLEITKEIAKAADIQVILPTGNVDFVKELAGRGINVSTEDFVKPTVYSDYLKLNLDTVLNIGMVANGTYHNQVRLAVKTREELELKAYNLGDTFGSLVNEFDDLVGLRVGYKYYDKTLLDKVLISDFAFGDHVVTPVTVNDCIVAQTKEEIVKNSNISCGNCLFCREGFIHLNVYIDNVISNKGNLEEMDFVKEIGTAMKTNNLCSVGNKGSELALSGLEVFENVYKEHIKEKKCLANVCKSFSTTYIDPKLCTGCGDCIGVCPVDCIDGKKGYIHMIDEFECTSCGKCIEVCDERAILKSDGKVPKLPRKLTKIGKF